MPNVLQKSSKKFSWTGISFPTTLKDVEKFEKMNDKYLVYVYGLETEIKNRREKNEIYILYKNKDFHHLQNVRTVINVLYFEKHYYPIVDLDKFHKSVFSRRKFRVCQSCLSSFEKQDDLEFHKEYCQHEYMTRMNMPKKKIYRFDNYSALKKYPFVCYLDSESALEPIDENCGRKKENSDEFTTNRYQRHDPIA